MFTLDGSGLRLNSYASPPALLTIVTDDFTGLDGLMQDRKYLNISSKAVVSLSLTTFQPIQLFTNGAIQVGGDKYVSISADFKLVLSTDFITSWIFTDFPNRTALSTGSVSVYNDQLIPYFPYDYDKLADLFQPPTCNGEIDEVCGTAQCKTSEKHSYAWGTSNRCDNSKCDDGLTFIYCDVGGFAQQDHSYCYRHINTDNMESCALALDAETVVGGKMNPCTCELGKEKVEFGGRCFTNEGGDGCNKSASSIKLQNQAYAPWSADVATANNIKQFCSQHDTDSQGPYLFSDSRCINWASDDPKRTSATLDQYCQTHPDTMFCADFCATRAGSTTCNNSQKAFCDQNLGSPVCKEWCKNKNVDCDSALQRHCQGTTQKPRDPLEALATDPDLCGCFLKPSFYTNYYADLSKQFTIPASFPPLKQCSFAPCASSRIQPTLVKTGNGMCPNVQLCITDVEFNNEGHINGDVKIDANNVCKFYTPLKYEWDYGTWSACKNGAQTRKVSCLDTNGKNATLDKCNPSSLEPDTQECKQYDWDVGKYDGKCEAGYEYRSVTCLDLNTRMTISDESKCSAVRQKPAARRECSSEETYTWRFGEFSAECRDGVKTRSVDCIKQSNNAIVDPGYCASSEPHSSTQDCYEWQPTAWTACSGSPSTRTRDFVCKGGQGNQEAPSGSCEGDKPDEVSESCPEFEWSAGGWQDCADGHNKRVVNCVEAVSRNTTLNSNCVAGTKPINEKLCEVKWKTGEWKDCSWFSKTREVTCVDSKVGTTQNDSFCASSPPPPSSAMCMTVWSGVGVAVALLVVVALIVALVIYNKKKIKIKS
jgi:hypothetical protein